MRVTVRVMNWDAYVHLAYDEIRQAGAGTPQVARRLRASLEDLVQFAPPYRRPVLHDQLRLLDLAIQPGRRARHPLCGAPDRQGVGVAAGRSRREHDRRFAPPPDSTAPLDEPAEPLSRRRDHASARRTTCSGPTRYQR